MAIPITPDSRCGEESLGYHPAGLAQTVTRCIAEDMMAYMRAVVGPYRAEHQWAEAIQRMLVVESLGTHKGFEVRLEWPGGLVGILEMGLAEAPSWAEGWCSVRLLAGLNAFYTAAMRRSEDEEAFNLRECPPNLAALMGINTGSCQYNCHLLTGFQGCVVLGGQAIGATGRHVHHPEGFDGMRHSEGSLVGAEAFEAAIEKVGEMVEYEAGRRVLEASRPGTRGSLRGRPRTSNAARSIELRYDEEFVRSYARDYFKRRVEIIALAILQAKAKAKVARIAYRADRVRQTHLGQSVTTGVNVDNFLRKKKRRELSMALLVQSVQDGEQGQRGAGMSPQRTAWMVGGMSLLLRGQPGGGGRASGGSVERTKRVEARLAQTARFTAGQGAEKSKLLERSGNSVAVEDYIR